MGSEKNVANNLSAETLSIETLRILIKEEQFDAVEAWIFQFLNQRFGGDDSHSRSRERGHLTGFCGVELRKWREAKDGGPKWLQILRRCDSTPALKAYLVKCLRTYMAGQRKRDQPEKYSQRARIRKILQQEEPFHARTRRKGRDYGLQIWTTDPQERGEFHGDMLDPRILKRCGELPAFSKQSLRYRKQDLIHGCEFFLKAVNAYARACSVSDAVEAYWAPCTSFNVEFQDTDVPEQAETRRILREEAFELIGEFINVLTDEQLLVLRMYSLAKFYGDPISSTKVAADMGCSHGTVCNRHTEVTTELQNWLRRLQTDDQVHVCKFLMEYFENPTFASLSPAETMNKGEKS